MSSVRSDWVNPGAGPFNIPSTKPEGIPTIAEKVAFFGKPTPGTDGPLGRNTFEGPGFANVDLSLFKNFKVPAINEDSRLQLRFEVFTQPEPELRYPTFGRSGWAFDARQIQFGRENDGYRAQETVHPRSQGRLSPRILRIFEEPSTDHVVSLTSIRLLSHGAGFGQHECPRRTSVHTGNYSSLLRRHLLPHDFQSTGGGIIF